MAAPVAEEPAKAEEKSVTRTFEIINSECDFDITDAMALDLLKFVSKQKIPVDTSEVEGVLEARRIRLTIKAKRWIDIISHTADQIGASVVINRDSIKLVANNEARSDQKSEQAGAAKPVTDPEPKPMSDEKAAPESTPAAR